MLRFTDFVFRDLCRPSWHAHETFFQPAKSRHLGPSVLAATDQFAPHRWPARDAIKGRVMASDGLSRHG